ncbi:hypothetical protein EDD37DRAFT_611065 [Exophiala viscosa]|uniref:uncharacterized protein n=1 Tax=Exophiala viscosa TaxID=2486360 RepID=UPI0021A1583A|nr:hypothetical protein EDD37DRAFT_611065 [Exophiala viscosa]
MYSATRFSPSAATGHSRQDVSLIPIGMPHILFAQNVSHVMAVPSKPFQSELAGLTWRYITQPAHKNGLFKQVSLLRRKTWIRSIRQPNCQQMPTTTKPLTTLAQQRSIRAALLFFLLNNTPPYLYYYVVVPSTPKATRSKLPTGPNPQQRHAIAWQRGSSPDVGVTGRKAFWGLSAKAARHRDSAVALLTKTSIYKCSDEGLERSEGSVLHYRAQEPEWQASHGTHRPETDRVTSPSTSAFSATAPDVSLTFSPGPLEQ